VSVALLHDAEVSASELPAVTALLAQSGLPTDDVNEPGRRFWRFCERGDMVAVAGLEIHGAEALLRSVALVPSRRSRGIGRDVVGRTLAHAATLGARRVFLLTTTTPEFFTALGFTPIERKAVPKRIAATREFTTLCPASAVCMMKVLMPTS
jgi:amino-acid N-acetyltransferase